MAEQKNIYILTGRVCTNYGAVGVPQNWELRRAEIQAANYEEALKIAKEEYANWLDRELILKTD